MDMNCPKCGAPMEKGTMYCTKIPCWTQSDKLPIFRPPKDAVMLRPLGDTSTSNAVPLSGYSGVCLCRACGIVCFPYQLP